MTAFDSQEYLSRFGAALSGAQNPDPGQSGDQYGAQQPMSGGDGTGALTAGSPGGDAAPGLNDHLSGRIVSGNLRGTGAGMRGHPMPAQNAPQSVPADLGTGEQPPGPPAVGALPQSSPASASPAGGAPADPGLPTAPGSATGLGSASMPNPDQAHQDTHNLTTNLNFDKHSPEVQDQLADQVDKYFKDQSNGVHDLNTVYAKARDLGIQNAQNRAAIEEANAQDKLPAPTRRDKVMLVMDALQRAAIAQGSGMTNGMSAFAYGAQGAVASDTARRTGVHDAAIAQSKAIDAAGDAAGDKAVNLQKEQDLTFHKYLNDSVENKLKGAQTDEASAKAAAATADAQPGSQKSRLTESEISKNNAARDKDKAQDKTETLVKPDGSVIVVDRNTGKSRDVTDESGKGVTAKKPGTEGAANASSDKLLTQARLTFEGFEKSAAARNKGNLNPKERTKDTTADSLNKLRTTAPDQYDAFVGNPPGTTKSTTKGAAPATAAAKPAAAAAPSWMK